MPTAAGVSSRLGAAAVAVLAALGPAATLAWAQGQLPLVLALEGEADDDDFGASVAGPGDVDGDGWPDLLIGAGGWGERVGDVEGAGLQQNMVQGQRPHRC